MRQRTRSTRHCTRLVHARADECTRVCQMVRILRIFRFLHVFDMIENLLRPPPLLFRVFRSSPS
eukprot:540956-Rhodomonas_salina.1